MRLFETTLKRIAAALCLALAMLVPQVSSAQTAYPGFHRIVICPGTFTMPTDQCDNLQGLHNENGKLELGRIQPNWWSAQWEIVDAGSGQFTIRNRYTGEYLAATFNDSLPEAEKWQILLVKPDTVISSFNRQSGTVQTRPASDLSDTMIWNIAKGDGGILSIFNSAVIGQHYLFRNGPKTGSLIARVPEGRSGTSVVEYAAKQTDLVSTDGKNVPVMAEAFWQLQSTGEVIVPKDVDIVRIVTAGTLALNIENGPPALGQVAPGWLSAQWIEQRANGGDGTPITLFRNVWTSKYLAMQGGTLTMMDRDPAQENQGLSRLPYAWRVTAGNGPGGFAKAIQNGATKLYLALDKEAFVGTSGAAQYIWTTDDAREAPPPPPPEPDVLVRLLLGGDAVNVETGPVMVGPTPPNFWSGDWIYTERVVERRRLVSFRNRWKGQYLMIRNGAVVMADPVNPDVINDPKQMEEMWQSEGVNDQALVLRHLRTGLYLGVPNKGNIPASPTPTSTDKTPWRVVEVK